MARARNIKPGFFRNEILAELSPLTRLLFAGLWTIADRAGRLEDRPKRIKADLLPYDDADVDALLAALDDAGFIVRYKHGTDRYIQIVNFAKHQNPHKNEAPSEIPEPTEHSTSTVQAPESHSTAHADSLNLDTDSLIPDSLNDDARDERAPADEPAKPQSQPQPARINAQPFDLLEALCQQLGQDVSVLSKNEKGKQLSAAKRLAMGGMSAGDVRTMTGWLQSQTWMTSGIDMFSLEKYLSRWQLAGKPAQPRASPPPQRATYRGKDIGLSNDELMAIARGERP